MGLDQTIYDIDNISIPVKQPKKQIRAPTTWHLKPKPTSLADWIARHDLGPPGLYEPQPDEVDRGPVPHHSIWRENSFILRRLLLPLLAQWAFLYFTDIRIEGGMAVGIQFVIYEIYFIVFAIHVFHRCQYYMQKYGTLNEHKRGRDLVPDSHHDRVSYALVTFILIRNIGIFVLGQDSSEKPHLGIWSPMKIGAFQIVLDYFFYFYHRSAHEFDFLWFIHQQHHATKSPTPSLSLWADNYQDILEWAIVPFLAYKVVHLSFAELWLASGYTLYVEAMGHSGIRAYWSHPLLTPILKPFGMEIAIEDHDLHHRYGRGGKNYGKQTRVWDVLFGTAAPREEDRIYASFVNAKRAC
ncbi:hypothetical protein PILCRDRAFT_606638 [Piloderma croceum F 1598]|uniref:Fatty acid hydroxylase domain-containing protein n=1 Tax=Piloderma croceum (strain F 1598) TaxID=765440 RepID=A0A0C3EZH3_PILCF|nr:hypothetical protein PILCRDRAFT_606638 [Piloderma croceum F 1598]